MSTAVIYGLARSTRQYEVSIEVGVLLSPNGLAAALDRPFTMSLAAFKMDPVPRDDPYRTETQPSQYLPPSVVVRFPGLCRLSKAGGTH